MLMVSFSDFVLISLNHYAAIAIVRWSVLATIYFDRDVNVLTVLDRRIQWTRESYFVTLMPALSVSPMLNVVLSPQLYQLANQLYHIYLVRHQVCRRSHRWNLRIPDCQATVRPLSRQQCPPQALRVLLSAHLSRLVYLVFSMVGCVDIQANV